MTKHTLNQDSQAKASLTPLNTGKKRLIAKLNRYGKKLGLAGAIAYKLIMRYLLSSRPV